MNLFPGHRMTESEVQLGMIVLSIWNLLERRELPSSGAFK